MTKPVHAQTLIQAFESWAPQFLAYEKDKIGLQIGTLNKRINKVMVTLDVLENVVDEAIANHVDLIIAHHPVIFHPLKQMRSDFGQGKIVTKCIKHDIAVYVAHSNLDIADGGVNDLLADALGLKETEILLPTYDEKLYKLVVFVPEEHAESLREALGRVGAGSIGNYSHCSFNSKGKGMFKPQEDATPFIGKVNTLETVNEVKIEVIVPESLLKRTVSKMLSSHPYEEVAYDVILLNNTGKQFGLGRIGKLEKQLSLVALAEHVKQAFDVPTVRITGNKDAVIQKVAIIGGDGNDYLSHALFKGADVLITGDVYYHKAHDAIRDGLNLIDPGHHIEKVMKQGVKQFIDQFLLENKYDTDVIISEVNTNPFQFV